MPEPGDLPRTLSARAEEQAQLLSAAEMLAPAALHGAQSYPEGTVLRGDPARVYSVSDVLLHRPCGLPCIDHPNPLRPDLGCPASTPEENPVDEHTYSVTLAVTVSGREAAAAAAAALAPSLGEVVQDTPVLHVSLTVSDLHEVQEETSTEYEDAEE